MQHGHLVGDVLDEFHVVLDHQHRAVLDDRIEQLRGLDALADAHAGDRLIEHQQVWILDQQHADLEPLLLAVREHIGIHVEAILQEDHLGDLLDAFAHRGITLEHQRTEHRAPAWIGNLQILEHREIVIDGRRLELAADTGLHDLVLLELGQLLAAELHRPRRGFGFAANQVEHRGLAGTVRADDDADLVLLDIEREIVHRFETVEGNGEPFDREQEVLGLMTDKHDVSPYSAGAPSAVDLMAQAFRVFDVRSANSRST